MRRVLPPVGLTLAALFHVLTGGCSSSSELAGGGGCDSFCTKWVGARCRNGPTSERCLTQCREEQTRCRAETNALLKCATIEAQIACESGSGEPRIVGCAPREAALDRCLACAGFCERWAVCPAGPTRDECVATCLDPRCVEAHRRIVDCVASQFMEARCDPAVGPIAPEACNGVYWQAQSCTRVYGQDQPFRWLPVESPADGGADG